ncbi:MAG: hypothetical protein LBP83_04165 [Dysgonamonadaceae bacterium]|jgi:hypothetical protein|nr:hypothetical protein [Dysgonamonadaceae bacterium]
MLKSDVLIFLVNSLSKSEKKVFSTHRKDSDYKVLFDIIEKEKNISSQQLKAEFEKQRENANFNATVSYLYEVLLNELLALRENRDSHYSLFTKALKTRILFEKALYEEAFNMLDAIKEEASWLENFYALQYASRLELEYLLFVNFLDISEKELQDKHFKMNEISTSLRKINEHYTLYELLKYRIIHKGNIRSQKQRDSFNDFVISEMSMMASSNTDSFETKKLHQLFQSDYLIGAGDYKSALHSYYELNRLFETNKHLWSNPPYYYLSVIEGVLDSLRSIKSYDQMPYFIGQLKNIRHPSVEFQTNVNCLIFLYELFPLLDKGDFGASEQLMEQYRDSVLEKRDELNLIRQAELSLYTALIHIGLLNFKAARKDLANLIIRGKSFYAFPLYRTIRLVNLIIQYETGKDDIIHVESRSLKRELSKTHKAYRMEHLMLSFLNSQRIRMMKKKEKMWPKFEPELMDIRNDVYENQLLKLFDFTAWIEAKILKIPLAEVLAGRKALRDAI